tara:strand:+ start:163 stop:537 length:375 start_codon:yes stop_codon:yes gene_type:complete
MAEEIIDIRDRIEKMRIQIENEATEQISADIPLEVRQKTGNSNISLSMENKKSFPNQNFEVKKDSLNSDDIVKKDNKNFIKNETFPAVSLSVKNPVSSKILILLVTLQILSNIGILYFLYLGME